MIGKKVCTAVAATALMFSAVQASAESDLKTVTDRVSYIFGYNIGQKFKQDQVEIDMNILVEAFNDASAGKEPRLSSEDMQTAMRALQDMQNAKKNVLGESNLKEGAAFLAENAKKDGVITTESGLQYKIITEGKGPKPTANSRVSVHYSGTLLDGTEFDSSYKRGTPAVFGVTKVIPGWTEALQLMPEGSKWELYIPSDLAYGAGGGPPIGPNSTLLFEVELLSANAQ